MKLRTVLAVTAAAAAVLAGCSSPQVNTGSVSPASGQAAPNTAAADAKKPPTWGERYTWPTKLAVEVAKPVTCKPGKYASPPNVVRAVKVAVTVINDSEQPFDASLLSAPTAQFAGASAEAVFDSNGPCGSGSLTAATVLPHKTYKLDLAFAVGKDPGELQVELQPDFAGDKAVFVGQA